MTSKFRWEGDLIQNLEQFNDRAQKALVASAGLSATMAEEFMRENAPWTDRTTNARSGLKARVVVKASTVALVMYHSVDYGVWLEVRWGGKYGIIPATMAAVGPFWGELLGRMIMEGATES